MQAVTITQITAPELETLIENSIKKVLSTQQPEQPTETDRWFDLTGLCNYLPTHPRPQTIYGLVSAGKLPTYKDGKKLRFLKSEIDSYLLQGKKKTLSEIDKEVDSYLKTKKG